jgi:hypothetical protein
LIINPLLLLGLVLLAVQQVLYLQQMPELSLEENLQWVVDIELLLDTQRNEY